MPQNVSQSLLSSDLHEVRSQAGALGLLIAGHDLNEVVANIELLRKHWAALNERFDDNKAGAAWREAQPSLEFQTSSKPQATKEHPVTPESLTAIAGAVRSGSRTARSVVQNTFNKIRAQDPALNCFTRLLEERAFSEAHTVDALIAEGKDPGPLAGVPYAVKDLFDIAGFVTTAGAKLRETSQPALVDSAAVSRLKAAGAILVGTLNMDEFAYGFSTENAHYGVTRNPHDPDRLAGGSSGGSAAAVAAGFVPLALGSDTNGSVRVPASLCGVFGLRPTHGAISDAGTFPFVKRLDTVGLFARTLDDLQQAFAVLSVRAISTEPEDLRIGLLDGWFHDNADDQARRAVQLVAQTLGARATVTLRRAGAARSAAFLLTAFEGGQRHLAALRQQADAFDPATRRRLLGGNFLPPEAIADAELCAKAFISEFEHAMDAFDVLVAPATPTAAPQFSEGLISFNGQTVSARANLGVCTQPLSLTEAPSISVPLARSGQLPLGVQLIAAKGREGHLFAAIAKLVKSGIVACEMPVMFEARRGC